MRISGRNRLIFYPLLLALLVFLVDKVALIPGLMDAGRAEMTPFENMVNTLTPLLQQDRRPVIFTLGTSRSDIFHYLSPATIRGSGLSQAEKQRLLRATVETRGVIRASEMFLSYAIIHRIVEENIRPDLIVLEVSPEVFNKNSPYHLVGQLHDQVFSWKILKDAFFYVKGRAALLTLEKILFVSYGYRFRPERALSNLAKGKRIETQNIATAILLSRPTVEDIPANYLDFPEKNMPAEIYAQRFRGYADYLIAESILKNYSYDESEKMILLAALNMIRDNNLPVVVWMPPVHPVLQEEWKNRDIPEKNMELKALLKNLNVAYFSGPDDVPVCDRFSDASHLSRRCGPAVMNKILDTYCQSGGEGSVCNAN